MITVNVRQHVCSEVPGRVGNWSYRTSLELPWVPSPGMLITFLDGSGEEYFTEVVKDVFISTAGVNVDLVSVKRPGAQELDEMDARGWEKLGGPWKDQAVSAEVAVSVVRHGIRSTSQMRGGLDL
jgi:hypothetical protein